MQGTILLNHNDNTSLVEQEERYRFLANVLDAMGVPTEDIWDEGLDLSVEKRIKLRSLLSSYNVHVIEMVDGTMSVYLENDLIASWQRPEYTLKKDYSSVDPRKSLYLEMRISCSSIFENETE
jgi:hypothetical protein